MRIQYVKQGGDGRVVDMEQGAAKRLIAAGQAVEVAKDQKAAATGTRRAAGAKAPRTAKKKTAAKKTKRAAAKKAAAAPAAGETGT